MIGSVPAHYPVDNVKISGILEAGPGMTKCDKTEGELAERGFTHKFQIFQGPPSHRPITKTRNTRNRESQRFRLKPSPKSRFQRSLP